MVLVHEFKLIVRAVCLLPARFEGLMKMKLGSSDHMSACLNINLVLNVWIIISLITNEWFVWTEG